MNNSENINWREIVAAFSSYEGTSVNFCNANHISKSQLYYYRNKFEKEDNIKFHAISMKEELLKRNYIHADETYVKVIEENGKDSKSKRFMWLYGFGGI